MKKRFVSLFLGLLCIALFAAAAAEETDVYAVGSTVIFGTYEQDNDPDNGAEALEWIVLENDGEKAFLLSRYCIDTVPYNEVKTNMTWAQCTLRTWLNSTFMDAAFTREEQAIILETEVVNDNNPYSFAIGGADTVDQVYLLSIEECLYYLPTKADRIAQPTAYAVANNGYVDDNKTLWWLRSPGTRRVDAAAIGTDGTYSGYGSRDVNRPSVTVRPVLWITLGE